MKIIIELPESFPNWPRKRIKMLQKWLSELSVLLSDGSFMNYTKTVKFEEGPMGSKERGEKSDLDTVLLRLIELNENPQSIEKRFMELDALESGDTG